MASHRKLGMTIAYFLVLAFTCRSTRSEGYPNILAEQLNRYCEWQMGHDNRTSSYGLRAGKAGPRGPAGPPGPGAEVDYESINRLINQSIAGQNTKISLLEDKIIKLEKTIRKLTLRSCKDVHKSDAKVTNDTGGVFDIYPGDGSRALEVYCDLSVDGGDWIVFQRRMDGSENFQRNFADYESGFGRREGEFWLGLRNLHMLTKNGAELRVDVADWEGNTAHAKYSNFKVGDASSQYMLTVGGYSGTAGDALTYHTGQKFFTRDRDNGAHCSRQYRGGMWYKGCFYANLNGIYLYRGTYTGVPHGVEWYQWKGRHRYSLKFAEMKLRIL